MFYICSARNFFMSIEVCAHKRCGFHSKFIDFNVTFHCQSDLGTSRIHTYKKKLVEFFRNSSLPAKSWQDPVQWRIQDFPDGGAPTPEGGAPTYYLTNFSQKLHENEENLTQRGGRASLRPPLDPPMLSV